MRKDVKSVVVTVQYKYEDGSTCELVFDLDWVEIKHEKHCLISTGSERDSDWTSFSLTGGAGPTKLPDDSGMSEKE